VGPYAHDASDGEKTGTVLTVQGEFAPGRGSIEIGCSDPPKCTNGSPAALSGGVTSEQAVVALPNSGTGSSGFDS
jgi:hypothetical protein